jgi:hypothetical protein
MGLKSHQRKRQPQIFFQKRFEGSSHLAAIYFLHFILPYKGKYKKRKLNKQFDTYKNRLYEIYFISERLKDILKAR